MLAVIAAQPARAASLAITKTAPATVVAGTQMTYTLVASNPAVVAGATNVQVTDVLPAGLSLLAVLQNPLT